MEASKLTTITSDKDAPAARRRRTFVAGMVALALIVLISALASRGREATVAVQVEAARRGPIAAFLTASGEVRPRRFATVSASISGRITKLLVDEGEPVRRGQRLAQIDATRLEASTRGSLALVEAQRAEVDRAQAEADLARYLLDQASELHAGGSLATQALEHARAESKMKTSALNAARRRMTQMEAVSETERDDLEKATVVSPMDGVVISVQKREGEAVIGAQSFSPTVILTVADPSVMEVEIAVDETDVNSVAVGQTAEVTVDAFPNTVFAGDISAVGSSAVPR